MMVFDNQKLKQKLVRGKLKLNKAALQAIKPFVPSAIIVMYHRVGDPDLDPWSLHVTPKNFQEQMEVLRQYAKPIGLRELAQAHQDGEIPERAVAVTFDDGYADNLYNAKPILERYDIPATFFIATGHLGKERKFWWDELQHLLLQPGKLPEKLTINTDGTSLTWELGAAANYSPDDYKHDKGKLVWKSKPGTRFHFYHSVWQQIQCLPIKAQLEAMNQIQAWVGEQPATSPDDRSLTPQEVCTLELGGLANIGAHTVTHPSLNEHSADFQLKEIQESKAYLEKLLNHSVTTFAYPYGNYTSETARLVQQAGFECACSTVEKMVWSGSGSFELPRYTVNDWSGEEFAQKLKQWL